MRRKIITIDQDKCNGCGLCASGCPEGALKVVDGKARLVGELLCDGLGACLSTCPENAIRIEEREAAPYDEIEVIKNIIPQGMNVLKAHLQHLKDHRQEKYIEQATHYLREHAIVVELPSIKTEQHPAGHCPGSRSVAFAARKESSEESHEESQLTHWPVQLHLIAPSAPHFRDADLLIAADCVAYALAGFHRRFLKDRKLVIACPKLDSRQEVYTDKLIALIDEAGVKTIKVMIMQVPCCSGLLQRVVDAASRAKRKVPVSCVIVGLSGEILSETPIESVGS